MSSWTVERIVHFGAQDFVIGGLAHFGFHLRTGDYYPVLHQRHVVGSVDRRGRLAWTCAATSFAPGVRNITAALEFPMFVDALADGSLIVSNLNSAVLHRIDPERTSAAVLIEGRALGMVDMGNCVVDRDGSIWVNEVTGCRLWHFDSRGGVIEVLGDGEPGFQRGRVAFQQVRWNWIYDIRWGPDDRLYVLDSRNFALRLVDPHARTVTTIAGTGEPGYGGDGGDARSATLGGDRTARFDGPISLAIDHGGNAYIGDRFNHVVRCIDAATGSIDTIAGRRQAPDDQPNDERERDPARLNLPQISSLDYSDRRLFVPTDFADQLGDLVVMRRD